MAFVVRARMRVLALAGADAVALVFLRGDVTALVAHAGSPEAWTRAAGADGVAIALAGAALWLVAAWVGIGLVAALASTVPGAAGRAAARLGAVVLPRVLWRVIAGTAGLGVFLTPVVAGAAPASSSASFAVAGSAVAGSAVAGSAVAGTAVAGSVVAGSAAAGPVIPGPAWPVSSPAGAPHAPASPTGAGASTGPGTTVTPPVWPATPSAGPGSAPSGHPPPGRSAPSTAPRTSVPSTIPRSATPHSPVTRSPAGPSSTPHAPTAAPPAHRPTSPAAKHPTSPVPGGQPTRHHHVAAPGPSIASQQARVHDGDSLWLLGARRLGPDATDAQIAHYWPRLYAANRNVIGDDPAHITPGQVLHEPAPTNQETS